MKKRSLLFVLSMLVATIAWSQRTITGNVAERDGEALIGASVFVQGTSVGTVTDLDGNFSLTLPEIADVLVVSYTGYQTREIRITDESHYVILMEIGFAMDEIVVVGYGVQQRRNISGSISSVSGEAIRNIPVQSFDQALQGKASGVNLTMPNAVLGNPPIIRVRGFNSISGSSSPLIIIDGVPAFAGDLGRTSAAVNPLGDISPADIESIEILKDASATAIYGSQAANGVVLITTRKGKAGDTRVNYDVSAGWTSAYRLYDLMNAEQYVSTKNHARENAGLAPAYVLAFDSQGNLIDTDWNEHIYQTGFQHSHGLNISGGSRSTSYYLGLNYSDSEGILRTNTYTRKAARANIDHRMTRWLSFGANVGYTNTFSNSPSSGSLPGSNFATSGAGRLAFVTAPIVPAFLEDGSYNIDWDFNRVGVLENTQPVGFFHPVWLQDFNYGNSQTDRLLASANANIKFTEGLIFRSVFGIDESMIESKQFWHPDHGDGRTRGGDAFNYFDRRSRWNWTNTLNYMFTIADDLDFNLLVGTEERHSKFNGWSAWRSELGDPFFRNFQGNWVNEMVPPAQPLSENYFVSYFGRMNMNWAGKYYLELSGRRDGFSGLAADNKYGNFGGVSAMWNISREDFFADGGLGNTFSDLRIKSSYGKVGNISGVGSYASLFLYGAGTYNSESSLFFNQAGNADLEWETSKKFDIGLAFGLMNDRFQFDIGYFQTDIDGLILNVPQSPSKGIPGNVLPQNVGSMINRGVEFEMTSYNVTRRDFSWTTNFNLTYLKNEVTSLAEGVPFIAGVTHLETTNRTLVGQPLGMIWGVETLGVDPATGRRMFNRINEDGTTTVVYYGHGSNWPEGQAGWREADGTSSRAINITDDGVPLGSPIPKFFGGLDNTFTFRDLDFNIGLTYAIDVYVYNGSKAGLRDQRNWQNEAYVAENYWREPGQDTDIPKPVWGDNVSNGSTMVQSQNVERADFLKVRNLSLGYTFRDTLIRNAGINSIRLYVQVFNALTITGYSGADPEISSMGDTNLAPGVDRNTIPQARTVAIGANISF